MGQGEAAQVRKSHHVSAFGRMGAVFLYHDLYGFILEMSPDVLGFLDAFTEPAVIDQVCPAWADRFEGADPRGFADVFLQFRCLVQPDVEEISGIWDHVPLQSRWNVWRREDDGGLTLFTAWGDRPVTTHRLSPEEARLFDSFDGEHPLAERVDDGYQPTTVERLVARLAHHDVQAIKLSPVPLSAYGGRRDLIPPYLTSTMPYEKYVPGGTPSPVGEGGGLSPAGYYREVGDARAQFDEVETTLSHLFRVPHPALGGRTYGQALVDHLAARELLPIERIRVLEVGAGLGFVAQAVHAALRARGLEVDYEIVELSPALAAAQRERLAGLGVRWREGDILELELPQGAYDLIVSNEMIGDLPAIQLTHEQAGIGADPPTQAACLEALGEPGRLAAALKLELGDAPDPFYLTWGAYAFLERAASALAAGGTLFVSEFGDLGRHSRLSTHLDHPELSIHFGLYADAARALGLEAEVEFVMDLLDMHRDLEGLATTRSYFRALTAMLADSGVALEKIGYTRKMFHQLLDGKVDPTRIGELHFDKIEDRLMGLVPHEFKALVARRR